MSFFEIKGAFLHFSRKRQEGYVPNFFLGFRRKHLVITTCIEKQCTRPLILSYDILRSIILLGFQFMFKIGVFDVLLSHQTCLKSVSELQSVQCYY